MLLKIKLLIVKPIYYFIKQFYFNQFNSLLKRNKNYKSIYIFDLDNTLAHTYPSLNNPDKKKMYKDLPTHVNMLALANTEIKKQQLCIILTARDYKYKAPTNYWLDNNLFSRNIPLFMVPKAKDKLPYLEKAAVIFNEVFYYDDLSYNHENGKVKLYDSVIEKVKKMSIKYFGYEEINQINQV